MTLYTLNGQYEICCETNGKFIWIGKTMHLFIQENIPQCESGLYFSRHQSILPAFVSRPASGGDGVVIGIVIGIVVVSGSSAHGPIKHTKQKL